MSLEFSARYRTAALIRESKLGTRYLKWIEKNPVSLFHRLAIKPIHLTFIAFFFSLMTIPAYGYALWLGGIGVLVSGAIDTMDGGLARKADQQSRSGAFLDSVLDRYSDFCAVFGIWVYFLRHPVIHPVFITALLFLFLTGSFMVSYSRARGEGLGVSTSEGFFSRAERVILLGAGSVLNDGLIRLFPSQSWLADHLFILILLLLLTLGTHITALQRIIYLAKNL